MKKKLKRLKFLKDTLVAIELEFAHAEKEISDINKELQILEAFKKELRYNIEFLKSDGIVAVASEYKKSIEQIHKVESKVMKLSDLKIKLKNQIISKTDTYSSYFDEYEKLYRDIESEQVILVFNKGKDGQRED